MASAPLPPLRPLDVSVVHEAGSPRFVLRDMEGVAPQTVVLSPAAYFIAASLDGKAGLEELAEAFSLQFGGAKPKAEELKSIVRFLDENYFLDSARYRGRLKALREEFAAADPRPAAHAGGVYAPKAGELESELDAYFAKPGPGLPQPRSAQGEGRLVGLVAPHIDFARGGTAYAFAYREVIARGLADLYVILGVAHAGAPSPFVLTLKDYDTPYGPARTDKELGRALEEETGLRLTEHELVHKGEHSAEFQAVWLKHAARKLGGDFKILPILCTGGAGTEEGEGPAVLAALEKLLKAYPGKVCLLAGADLAHIGPRFGDKEQVSELMEWMVREDQKSVDAVLALDAPGFYKTVMRDGGRRKVCGLGCLYALSWLLKRLHPEAEARFLKYGHAPDPAGGEVSFVSLGFYDS